MSFQRARKIYASVLGSEHGMALIVSLLAIALLTVLALGVVQNSIASWRSASNDRTTKAALAIAEGGAEYAREALRINLKQNNTTLNQLLATAANGGALVNATTLPSFGGSTGLFNGTANAPLVGTANFAAGTFQVFLTNDRAEPAFAPDQVASVQSTADTNNQIMITSFGSGPGGSLAVVQEQLRIFDAFLGARNMPGVLVLPGPSVIFQSFTSAARYVTGCDYVPPPGVQCTADCLPTVAVTTNAAKRTVDNEICLRSSNGNNGGALPYDSCPPFKAMGPSNYNCIDNTKPFVIPSTQNFLLPQHNPYDPMSPNNVNPEGDPRLISVKYLSQLVASIKAVADFHSLTDPGFTGGTTTSPKIIAIDGDQDFPNNWTGAGILLVTGIMNFKGGFTYDGVMLAIGKGAFVHGGNGNGEMRGVTLVANTQIPWSVNPAYVGVPSYQDNGGGSSSSQYSSLDLLRHAASIMPLKRVTFQQLR